MRIKYVHFFDAQKLGVKQTDLVAFLKRSDYYSPIIRLHAAYKTMTANGDLD